MLDQHVIREKALRLAVRTGVAPDLDFVWTTQRKETGRVCFGSFKPTCDPSCYWFDRCRALAAEPVSRASVRTAQTADRASKTASEPVFRASSKMLGLAERAATDPTPALVDCPLSDAIVSASRAASSAVAEADAAPLGSNGNARQEANVPRPMAARATENTREQSAAPFLAEDIGRFLDQAADSLPAEVAAPRLVEAAAPGAPADGAPHVEPTDRWTPPSLGEKRVPVRRKPPL